MFISKDDICQIPNLIDLENGKMLIYDHKATKSQGTRTINLSQGTRRFTEGFSYSLFCNECKVRVTQRFEWIVKKYEKLFLI